MADKKGHWKDNDDREYSMDDYSDREELVRDEFNNDNLRSEFASYLENEGYDWIDEFIDNGGNLTYLYESNRDAFIEKFAQDEFEEHIGENFCLGDTDLTWIDDEPEVKRTRKAILLVEIEIPDEDACVKTCFDKTIQYALEKTNPIKLEVRTLSDIVEDVKTDKTEEIKEEE